MTGNSNGPPRSITPIKNQFGSTAYGWMYNYITQKSFCQSQDAPVAPYRSKLSDSKNTEKRKSIIVLNNYKGSLSAPELQNNVCRHQPGQLLSGSKLQHHFDQLYPSAPQDFGKHF